MQTRNRSLLSTEYLTRSEINGLVKARSGPSCASALGAPLASDSVKADLFNFNSREFFSKNAASGPLSQSATITSKLRLVSHSMAAKISEQYSISSSSSLKAWTSGRELSWSHENNSETGINYQTSFGTGKRQVTNYHYCAISKVGVTARPLPVPLDAATGAAIGAI